MGNTWKVILAFVGVFIAGAVFGGLFTVRTAKKRFQAQQGQTNAPGIAGAPGGRLNGKGGLGSGQLVAPVMLQRLTSQLKLSEEQREKILPIVSRADEDMQWLRKENFRNTSRVLERMHGEIAPILTEAQRADLEVSKRNLQDRLKRAEGERRGEFFPRGGLPLGGPGARAGAEAAPSTASPAPKGN